MSGVYFAYDGSIHGDWVSHYAVRLAAGHAEKILHLVHVAEEQPAEVPFEKIDRIRGECRRLDVNLEWHAPSPRATWLQTLFSAVARGPDSYLVCGMRSRERKRGLLSGSVAEQLLRSRYCHVLAIRVVQPGLLGLPRQFLLPVSGHPRGFRSGLPFLKLFTGGLSQLHLLHVQLVSRWRFRMLSHDAAEKLQRPGQAYCERIKREIRDQIPWEPGLLDAQVVVSDDIPKEIIIAANKTKSRLIYMGASERNLTKRFFFGNPIEQVLRKTTCDVAVYRGLE